MSVTPSLLVGLGGIVSIYLLRSGESSASLPSDTAEHSEKDALDAEYEPDKFARRQARRKASLLAILALLQVNSLGRIGFDLVAERDGVEGRMLGDCLMALFWVRSVLLFRRNASSEWGKLVSSLWIVGLRIMY